LWDRLARDGTCRCIVLTGAGERAFSSGADMSGDLSADPETARTVNHALLKNRAYAKPIVAAVNGDCVAGGLELLLSTADQAAAREALEQELGDRVRKSEHFQEGVRAFLEKRNPNYT